MSSDETTCTTCGSPADFVEQTQIQRGFDDDPVTVHVKVKVCRKGCKPVQMQSRDDAEN
jgi:hypothetical protein